MMTPCRFFSFARSSLRAFFSRRFLSSLDSKAIAASRAFVASTCSQQVASSSQQSVAGSRQQGTMCSSRHLAQQTSGCQLAGRTHLQGNLVRHPFIRL